ncbi:MAG: sigma-70 family RNA polymerase sigma factor [Candidatus Caenarcaniphilales bacterium]|nr:sigma-70 family RNA polymerase sigma factor [Candidatus Caenarcaniphilales bacterium]
MDLLTESEYEGETPCNDELPTLNASSLTNYLKAIQKIPLLKPVEEIELARVYRRYRQNQQIGNARQAMEARNRLIKCNLRLVVSLAKKYSNCYVEMIELIQEGNLGLMRAVEKFDPDLGYRFSTYATWWIRQSILNNISEGSKTIRLPASVNEMLSKLRKVREILSKALGAEPSLDQISQVVDISEKQLERLLRLEEHNEQLVHLDSSYGHDENGEYSILDTISDESKLSPEEIVENEMLSKRLEIEIMRCLSEREAAILRLRYGLNPENKIMTLTELSKQYQVSLERIRQIEITALNKLRDQFMTTASL